MTMYKQKTITTQVNYKKPRSNGSQSYIWVVEYDRPGDWDLKYRTFTNKVRAMEFCYDRKNRGYIAKLRKEFMK